MIFHFDVIMDGEQAPDEHGLALGSPEEAYEEAVAVASALHRERNPSAPIGTILVNVRTSDGVSVCRVTLDFAADVDVGCLLNRDAV